MLYPTPKNCLRIAICSHASIQVEVIAIFEEIAGRSFQKQFVPEKTLAGQEANAVDPVEKAFAGLILAAARGDLINMADTLKKFSVRPKSVREYAKAVLGRAAA